MTDVTGSGEANANDAVATIGPAPGTQPGDVAGFTVQLAEQDEIIANSRAAVERARAAVGDAEATVARHEAEREQINAQLEQARAANPEGA